MQKYSVFLISGGTGFIGSQIVNELLAAKHKVYVLTRQSITSNNPLLQYIQWNPAQGTIAKTIAESDVCVIHLAGANVAGKRWSAAYLKEILDSRTQSTAYLWQLINNKSIKAGCFVGASATGYYGDNPQGRPFVETDKAENDFLGQTCVAWEQAVQKHKQANIATCIYRLGMVLGAGGGAVPQFIRTLPIAGIPGNGRQYYPWVHITDVVNAILFAANNELIGTYNLVSPQHETARSIITNLAKASKKFYIAIPSPAFVIKLILGKFSIEVLKDVRVSSDKLLNAGFVFRYDNIQKACEQIMATYKKKDL